MSNILIHVPHSSYCITDEYKKLFYLSPNELYQEQLIMSDTYTDEIFDVRGIKKLVFPVSRLVCDVERFRNEDDEEMTKQGMWVCYTKTSDLKPLKQVTEIHKQQVLEYYYDKHHSKFEKCVKQILKEYKKCLIIDAHSFPSAPLTYELHSQTYRPDICIGTDNFHTPVEIKEHFYNTFSDLGYKIDINNPFCGTIVPLEYYGKNQNVISIMIEINRALYMNEKTGKKSKNFDSIKNNITKAITSLKV